MRLKDAMYQSNDNGNENGPNANKSARPKQGGFTKPSTGLEGASRFIKTQF